MFVVEEYRPGGDLKLLPEAEQEAEPPVSEKCFGVVLSSDAPSSASKACKRLSSMRLKKLSSAMQSMLDTEVSPTPQRVE